MQSLEWKRRFLAGTRGRILTLLRYTDRTVNELAEILGVADNTVRAHLASLVRDGLVEQKGLRRGSRRPHYAYHLAPAAEPLFVQACDPVLAGLLGVLTARCTAQELEALLHAAGHDMAAAYLSDLQDLDQKARLEKTLEEFGALGGMAELLDERGTSVIRGRRCPFASVATRFPQVCDLAETFLSDLIGAPVQQKCDHGTPPHCAFELRPNGRQQ